jgi:hypothetical protein
MDFGGPENAKHNQDYAQEVRESIGRSDLRHGDDENLSGHFGFRFNPGSVLLREHQEMLARAQRSALCVSHGHVEMNERDLRETVSTQTVAKQISELSSIFGWLLREGHVDSNIGSAPTKGRHGSLPRLICPQRISALRCGPARNPCRGRTPTPQGAGGKAKDRTQGVP